MPTITAKFLPQLLTYEDEEAKRILRNLKKVPIKNEYQLVDVGVKEYVSIPKLDQKAFRYLEKNGKLYLRESVYSVGGLVQDSVLINLGDFTLGDDETGAELAYLAQIKDAKAKQRAQQLRECERLARNALRRVNEQVKNAELRATWENEIKEAKMFVRLGKEDYYQAQMAIIARFAAQDETLAKLVVDYDTKINAKNQKWLTQPLKLPRVKAADTRIGTQIHEGIGTLDPERRAEFEKFYAVRAPQMQPYLQGETAISNDLPLVSEIVDDKITPAETQTAATFSTERPKLSSAKVELQMKKLRHAFNPELQVPVAQAAQTTADAEMSR